jgi:hypothetical protein
MARIRFKKPKIAILMSEIITLTVWLYLGDQVIEVLDDLVGTDGNVTDSVFKDAYEIMGLGSSQSGAVYTSNTANGLLGVIGLIMVVMVLMNFITYN